MAEPNWVLEADPKRPYKMYAAMISAFLSSLLVADAGIPVWIKAVITGLVAALTVFITGNPLRTKKSGSSPAYGDEPLF